jgi:hypothetical protein
VDAGRAAINAIEGFLVRGERPASEMWVDFKRHDLTNIDHYAPWGER